MTRREILRTMGAGFPMLGFAQQADPLASKKPHFTPRAKHVIFLFLNGGPSQVDTFDPKPALQRFHGKPMPTPNLKSERKTGNLLGSPFTFKKYGQSGIEVSEIFSEVGSVIDDFCVIRSMHTERPNHEPSLLLTNCGQRLPGHPSMGSWITYGLGTMNSNLPGFVVLCPGLPVLGPILWTSSYLPGVYQGTYIPNNEKELDKLVPNLRNAAYPPERQAAQVDLLGKLNRLHMARQGEDSQLDAGIRSMEVAYRMQTEAAAAFDITGEPESVRNMYGDGDFARGCLMAVRLVASGVRMVQLYYGDDQPWDSHDDILDHRRLARLADRPIAALIRDLKQRGLLKETAVIVTGEFGRTPVTEVSGLVKVQNGRDHNNHGYTSLVAGGGFRGGIAYGATDEFGFKAVENPVDVHDLHATVLHQLGLDHTRLTYRYSGRDFRLTDVHGRVIKEILDS
jgi:hypothetical protein